MSVHRTTYLSKLRRAFLLRVHPDRFRHHNNSKIMTVESIQLQQASLVKALADRMNQPDVTAWLQQRDVTKVNRSNPTLGMNDNNKNNTYQYFIEKRDGSLLQTTLSLNRSVEDILSSMSNALQKSGAGTSIPAPPSQAQEVQYGRSSKTTNMWDDAMNDVAETAAASMTFNSTTNTTGNIDTRYDIRSNRRRDLKLFLQKKGQQDQLPTTSLQDQIRDLRNARMDAMSVALQVRRTFQFAAIDATETGWSSASATVLFRRLLTFHEEYAKRLHVTSFYPIRLVFSPREIPDDRESSIDVYGGIIRLNPASTSIQWLDTLRNVTSSTIQQINEHRSTALQNTKIIQRLLNIKISKGFTCSSQDYYEFLERLATDAVGTSKGIRNEVDGNANHLLQISSTSLTVEPLHAVVEADTICRRAVVTSAGIIRLGANMSKDDCIYSIHRLTSSAREQVMIEKAHIQQCDDMISNIKWQLGLQKVYRAREVVSRTEFIDSLTRFTTLLSQQQQQQFLFQPFTGNSLGIAPTGQSCQLADDGSVVLPHDWTYL